MRITLRHVSGRRIVSCDLRQDLNVGILEGNLSKHIGARVVASIRCKAIPLQAWTGPEGSRSLRPPDFKTVGT
jgi:hypothetical protein